MPKRPPKQTEPQALQIRGDDAVLSAVREWLAMFAPRPKPKLSEFMLEHACDDTGASITPFPFQLEMADAFTDPEPIQLFAGELDVPRIRVGKGTRSLEWRCVSALEPFHDEEKGARLSDSWHQLVWPGETGCANMTGTDKTSNWGVEKPPSAVRTTGGSLNPSFLGNIGL
jgi:hypothetical protein